MTDDMFGVPRFLYEELEKKLKAEKIKTRHFAKLYNAVNHMHCELGATGEIHAQHRLVQGVSDALFDIDGGVFKKMEEGNERD